jgi:uncharacterized protein (DUF2126 family)/transglutaminase-like putative cysteine protease
MTLHAALTHHTQYRYDRPVSVGPQIVRLRPAPHCRTPILAYSLRITPAQHFLNWQQDPFGNFLARVLVPGETKELSATVDLIADMAAINPFDFFVEESAVNYPFAYEPVLAGELEPYLRALPGETLFNGYLAGIERTGKSTIDFLTGLNRKLSRDIAYRVRMEPGTQTPTATLANRSGSCRDTGWLLVQLLRHLGFAARFVSGYLIQLRPDVRPGDGGGGAAEDVADLHAWAEVYLPGAGWIGLDPTSGLLAGEGHIPLAATPSPGSAAPIEGTHGLATVAFSVSMGVERIREMPRVTRPYSDAEWQAMLAAGDGIDARLQAGDVRLSVGGEPTFVALDDGLAPEWTIAALGPSKRTYADKLARRLRRRLGKGGLLHHGQGKWYPGEETARWAFAIYWRADGEALWRDAELISEEKPSNAATSDDAARFAAELSRRLGLADGSAIPAYEDWAHFLLMEQKLPLEVTPEQQQLDDPAQRRRLLRVLDQGLRPPVGYVLPLLVTGRDGRRRKFVTERWAFRRGYLFLAPGDSPIGLRLPLRGLPEISFLDYPNVLPADPFADQRALPSGSELIDPENGREAPPRAPVPASGACEPVRTALAIEPREGHLCVFLPPLGDGGDFAALVAAIEATAAHTSLPVRLEGYAPPFDARLSVIKVTPDPGVIEVNVHPATSWRDAVNTTMAVYEEAGAIGLGAEKFMLDGRQTGTGGGNHIVLGGITPADSPFLRRPDLLASIITFWQNHPSLSYLFCGLFVGPTSQAPRIDEARHDSLYELEIALRQIQPAAAIAPWVVDRIFRNLLVDVTGNTHRAEICIDKLYSPEGPMGRLGLVELRAFEMPPNPRMSLAQQLLIRALVASFWERPYRRSLVRWGTMLHDRFMLPHFIWADFQSVIAELAGAGLKLDWRWFLPHFEFRFPLWGTVAHAGVSLTLRQALEPWLVLGEQSGPGGTTRPVDSSLERIEVAVGVASMERYAVTCNGYRLPLVETATKGEAVAGVRFRAWPSTAGFHPMVPPHVPLTFDILDVWTGRSVGGCRYHVAHPGGCNYQALPVNALEGEARRRARFEPMGHSPGALQIKTGGVHPDFPLTLDLRRVP